VQQLMDAVVQKSRLFAPPVAYEWSLHPNDDGVYTNYAADNPPYGVMITFYQAQPQKDAPRIDILDNFGRVIRTISGTHKVGGKDRPYVPNKAGLNRYTWDFNVNGPVKWNGATNDFSNPETGPGVPPGLYSVRMTLTGRTYVQRFKVEPDPRSMFTQAEYQRSFDESMRQLSHVSQIDTVLNTLDDLKKSIDTALAAAKTANNAALTAKLEDASKARQTLFNSLAVNIRGEGTEDETALHEDVVGTFQSAQGLITPSVVNLITRVEAEYRQGIARYDAFVTGVLPGVNDALKQAGMKPLSPAKEAEAL